MYYQRLYQAFYGHFADDATAVVPKGSYITDHVSTCEHIVVKMLKNYQMQKEKRYETHN